MKVSKKWVVCLPLIAALASCKTASKHDAREMGSTGTAVAFIPVQDYEYAHLDVVYLPTQLKPSAFDKAEWSKYKAATAERKIASVNPIVNLAEAMVTKVKTLGDSEVSRTLEKLGVKNVDAKYAKTVLAYHMTLQELSDATLRSKVSQMQNAIEAFSHDGLAPAAYATKVKTEFENIFGQAQSAELNALRRTARNGDFAAMVDGIFEKRLSGSYLNQPAGGAQVAGTAGGSIGGSSGLNPVPKGNQPINSTTMLTSEIVKMADGDKAVSDLNDLLVKERAVALEARKANTVARDAGGEAARQKVLKGEKLSADEQKAYDAYEVANRRANETLGQVNKRRNEINETVAKKLEDKKTEMNKNVKDPKDLKLLPRKQEDFIAAQKMNEEVRKSIVDAYDLMIKELDAKNPNASAEELMATRADIETMKQYELETNDYIQYTIAPGERGMMRSYDPKCEVLNPSTSKDLVDMHRAFRDEVVERASKGEKICGEAFGHAFLDRFMAARRQGIALYLAADYAGNCEITPKGSRAFIKRTAQRAIAWAKDFKLFKVDRPVCK